MRQVHLTASLDYIAIHADCPLFGGIHRQGDWYKNLTFICPCHLLNAKTGKKSRWSAYAANWDYARRAVLLPLSHTRRLSDRTPVNASVAHSGRSSICILFSRLNQLSCTQPCVTLFHVCKSGTIDYEAVWDLSEGRLSSNVCCGYFSIGESHTKQAIARANSDRVRDCAIARTIERSHERFPTLQGPTKSGLQ